MFQQILEFLDTVGLHAHDIPKCNHGLVSLVLLYLAIKKGYEPLLLVPIAFGVLLANLPLSDVMNPDGFIYQIYQGVKLGVFTPLIFVGVGAMTDFGPLIANPITLLLGAAAQLGIFIAFLGATALGYTLPQAGSIGIIGGADGPTAIYLTSRLAPELLAPIAIAAYSYMALVPIIQPPIMKALVPQKERRDSHGSAASCQSDGTHPFPHWVTIVGGLLVPSAITLLGSLMLGNSCVECKVVERLSRTAQNELINVVTIFIGLSVGATAKGTTFLTPATLGIIALGLVAFAGGTAGGVILGRIMCALSGGRINPLIGAAGVSAVPMAARVAQKVGQEANPSNFLLMHAMGPNVSGVIGSAVVAGVFLAALG